jgi:hypothetical protein
MEASEEMVVMKRSKTWFFKRWAFNSLLEIIPQVVFLAVISIFVMLAWNNVIVESIGNAKEISYGQAFLLSVVLLFVKTTKREME